MDRGASRLVTTSAKIDEQALSGHEQTNNEYLEVGTNRICSGNGGRFVCRVSRVGEPQPLIEPPLPLCFSFYRPVSAPPHRSFVSLSIFLFLYLSWPHFAPTLYKYVSLLCLHVEGCEMCTIHESVLKLCANISRHSRRNVEVEQERE